MAEPGPIEQRKAPKGAGHPAGRDGLVAVAKRNGADNTLVQKPTRSGRKRFDGPDRVRKAALDHARRPRPPRPVRRATPTERR